MKGKIKQDKKKKARENPADERHRGLNAAGDFPTGKQRAQAGPRKEVDPGDTPKVNWLFSTHVSAKTRRTH